MRNSLRIAVLLLGVALVVLATGCGGGKQAAANNLGATGAGLTGRTGVTSANGNTGPTGAGPTGAGGSFASTKNCRAFATLAVKIAAAMAPASADPAHSAATAAQELKALADVAPSDIKADLQTIATAFATFVQKAKDSGYDFSSGKTPSVAQIAALSSAAMVFNSQDLAQAERHLRTWEQQNCTMK